MKLSNSLSIFIGVRYAGAKRRSQQVSFLAAISVLGLTLGVGLLITVLSVMNGFDQELREKILGLVPQASIHNRFGITDWQSVVDEVEKDAEVEAAAPFIRVNGLINFRKETETVLIYGIHTEYEKRVSLIESFLDESVLNLLNSEEPTVVLGKAVADKLNATVGLKVLLVVPGEGLKKAAKLSYAKVVGVLESKTELDSQLVLLSLGHVQNLVGEQTVSGVRLKLNDLFDAPNVAWRLPKEMGFGFYGNNWVRTHGNLYEAIHMSKSMVGLLVSLIIAIAAFNVVSTLVMVVIDKEADIAILRTMGAGPFDIVKIFIVLGSVIGLVGTALGVMLGAILSTFTQPFVRFIEQALDIQFLKSDVYPITYIPSHMLASDIIEVGLTAFAMCLMATLYPAWRASRVKPAEALRYE